jgi:hypothetical protein
MYVRCDLIAEHHTTLAAFADDLEHGWLWTLPVLRVA